MTDRKGLGILGQDGGAEAPDAVQPRPPEGDLDGCKRPLRHPRDDEAARRLGSRRRHRRRRVGRGRGGRSGPTVVEDVGARVVVFERGGSVAVLFWRAVDRGLARREGFGREGERGVDGMSLDRLLPRNEVQLRSLVLLVPFERRRGGSGRLERPTGLAGGSSGRRGGRWGRPGPVMVRVPRADRVDRGGPGPEMKVALVRVRARERGPLGMVQTVGRRGLGMLQGGVVPLIAEESRRPFVAVLVPVPVLVVAVEADPERRA